MVSNTTNGDIYLGRIINFKIQNSFQNSIFCFFHFSLAGPFLSAGGISSPGLVLYNQNTFVSVISSIKVIVSVLALAFDQTSNSLFAGGQFTNINNVPFTEGIAR